MSESDMILSSVDVAIFDITLVAVAMVTGMEYWLDSGCIQTVFETRL